MEKHSRSQREEIAAVDRAIWRELEQRRNEHRGTSQEDAKGKRVGKVLKDGSLASRDGQKEKLTRARGWGWAF